MRKIFFKLLICLNIFGGKIYTDYKATAYITNGSLYIYSYNIQSNKITYLNNNQSNNSLKITLVAPKTATLKICGVFNMCWCWDSKKKDYKFYYLTSNNNLKELKKTWFNVNESPLENLSKDERKSFKNMVTKLEQYEAEQLMKFNDDGTVLFDLKAILAKIKAELDYLDTDIPIEAHWDNLGNSSKCAFANRYHYYTTVKGSTIKDKNDNSICKDDQTCSSATDCNFKLRITNDTKKYFIDSKGLQLLPKLKYTFNSV